MFFVFNNSLKFSPLKMELPELEAKKESLEKELTKLLIPKDPQDDKNAILEIRAGTGGDEAAIQAFIDQIQL